MSESPRMAPEDSDGDGALESTDWLDRLRAARAGEPLGHFGPYELLGMVGRGGQGVVYRARDTRTGAIVAVKRLLVGEHGPVGAHQRLRSEVAAMRALSHPGVVRVLGVEAEATNLLIVMEWVDGVPLAEWAAGRSAVEIALLMAAVCDVIRHAHARGVVHRDLKPSNVLVDRDGAPRVLDFGLAKRDGESRSSLTRSSPFLGTLAYAAPELIAHGPEAIDARSDLYSLGVILHELLTGRGPYELGGSISSAVAAILTAEPAGLAGADLEERFRAILRRALAKRPEDRYGDASGMRSDLLAAAAAPAGRPGRAAGRSRSARPALLVAAGAGAAIVLAGFFLGSPRVRTPAAAGAREFLASNAALAIPADRSREAVVLHLTEVARRVGPGFRDRPLEEARARLALGRRFSEVASWDAVATQAARARDLLETQERTGSHEYAEALVQLGNAQIRNAQGVDETLFERAIAIEERREAPDPLTLGDAFSGLAMRHSSGNRPGLFKQAESEWARAFSWYERLRGPVHGRMLARLNYARMKARLGEFEASAVSYRRAIEEQRALPAMPSQEVGIVTGEYGDVLISLARWPEAEATLRRAIADRGEAHDYFLPICWSRLGTVVLQRGDAAEARRLFHTAIEMRLGILAAEVPDEPQFGEFRNRLAHRGLEPRDVVPLGQLLRRHAPTVTAGFRFTTLEVARAEEALGHASAAAALRHEVETLSHLPAEELPRQ